MCGVNHLMQQLIKGGIDRQQLHAGGRHHGIACGHVGHSNHAFQHESTLCIDDVVVLGLRERFDQLVFGVGAWVNELGQFLQEGSFVFAL